jgi:hypothetical protein
MLLSKPINVVQPAKHRFRYDLFGILSEAETSPHRMELSVQASGVVATDYNR